MELANNNRLPAIGGLELVKELCIDFYRSGDDNRDTDPKNLVWRMVLQSCRSNENLGAQLRDCLSVGHCGGMRIYVMPRPSKESVACWCTSFLGYDTYNVMYRFREQILLEDWFEYIFWMKEDALLCLPRL